MKSNGFLQDPISQGFVTVLDDGTIKRDIIKTLESQIGRDKIASILEQLSEKKETRG